MDTHPLSIAIVDYGLGNLFSVKNACESVGLRACITADKKDLLSADGIILPGVGAFGDAMANLKRLDLVSPLMDLGARQTPMLGICLGLQLFMSVSYEFGCHEGLNLIGGSVVRFEGVKEQTIHFKVPHIGWNSIHPSNGAEGEGWKNTLLNGLEDGAYMYFVHSFYVKPEDSDCTLAWSQYGDTVFCSALQKGNLSAVQFHPERSGRQGLKVYRNFSAFIQQHKARKRNTQ